MGLGKPKVPSYAATTSTNPYAKATVNQKGNSYQLNDFLSSMNQGVEANLPTLYEQLLNPNLDNAVSKARMDSFTKQLQSSGYQTFENNMNSLAQRGLLRSSAVGDMTNKLNQYQTSAIGDYANSLIANNVTDTSQLINTLLNQYMMGANLGQTTLGNAVTSNQMVNQFNQQQYQNQLAEYQTNMQAIQEAISAGITGVGAFYGAPVKATSKEKMGKGLTALGGSL